MESDWTPHIGRWSENPIRFPIGLFESDWSPIGLFESDWSPIELFESDWSPIGLHLVQSDRMESDRTKIGVR